MTTKLTSPADVRTLLDELEFKPSRVLGQNFLIDGNILGMIINHADITPGERVLEVGPGLGVLTSALLEAGAQVCAIEKDKRLCAYLKKRMGDTPQLELHQQDALDMDLPSLDTTMFVSNLPYSVGSRLIMEQVLTGTRPRRMVLTVQLDVADRMTAGPGGKQYGLMSILPQMYYEVRKVKKIKPSCFYPVPRVDSAIVCLERREPPQAEGVEARRLLKMIRRCFAQRRKMLKKLLSDEEKLRAEKLGIDMTLRPERLTVEQWGRLSLR